MANLLAMRMLWAQLNSFWRNSSPRMIGKVSRHFASDLSWNRGNLRHRSRVQIDRHRWKSRLDVIRWDGIKMKNVDFAASSSSITTTVIRWLWLTWGDRWLDHRLDCPAAKGFLDKMVSMTIGNLKNARTRMKMVYTLFKIRTPFFRPSPDLIFLAI